MSKVRIDKWLWSVRIFKSRTVATDACKSGRVKIGEQAVKPSYSLGEGEAVHVRKDGFNLTFRVKKLLQKRVGAPLARECYENLTPEEEMMKYQDWYVGRGRAEMRAKGEGRPTKKDRRVLEDFKDDLLWDDEDWEDS